MKNKDFTCFQTLIFSQFFMVINVKMPTIVGILTLMSMINGVLSCVEHEFFFITSEPECRSLHLLDV